MPVSLDADSIQSAGVALNPTIDVDQKDVDFETAIDAMLKPLGLNKSVFQGRGLVIHSASRGALIEQQHTLPNFPDDNELASKQFMSMIQSFFDPESWVRETDPATIDLQDSKLVVRNRDLVQQQIAELIKKINAAIRLNKNPKDEQAQQRLITRWNRMKDRLQQPTGFQKTLDLRLNQLLELVNKNSGITVLVDWDSLMPNGWTPATMVPGNIEEANLESALREIARSMNLTLRVIDESTLELTTFERAAQVPDLEVYPFGKILAGPLNEDQALRLITETLGGQLPHRPFATSTNPTANA